MVSPCSRAEDWEHAQSTHWYIDLPFHSSAVAALAKPPRSTVLAAKRDRADFIVPEFEDFEYDAMQVSGPDVKSVEDQSISRPRCAVSVRRCDREARKTQSTRVERGWFVRRTKWLRRSSVVSGENGSVDPECSKVTRAKGWLDAGLLFSSRLSNGPGGCAVLSGVSWGRFRNGREGSCLLES